MFNKNSNPKPPKLSRNARYIEKSYAAQDANRARRLAENALKDKGGKK